LHHGAWWAVAAVTVAAAAAVVVLVQDVPALQHALVLRQAAANLRADLAAAGGSYVLAVAAASLLHAACLQLIAVQRCRSPNVATPLHLLMQK
jgi:hypothetical protein